MCDAYIMYLSRRPFGSLVLRNHSGDCRRMDATPYAQMDICAVHAADSSVTKNAERPHIQNRIGEELKQIVEQLKSPRKNNLIKEVRSLFILSECANLVQENNFLECRGLFLPATRNFRLLRDIFAHTGWCGQQVECCTGRSKFIQASPRCI